MGPYQYANNRDDVTPLGRQLYQEIVAHGAISVAAYMQRCLADPTHGYYTTRSGIGRNGDFTTAPEISQVFGELIGLWAAVVWQQMGAPARLNLIELGPGRGQLLDDALRAARLVPGFLEALELHLVDINSAYQVMQAQRLAEHPVTPQWHRAFPQLDANPTIVIANEFLDTVPGRQFVFEAGNWKEICVGLGEAPSDLSFVNVPVAELPFDLSCFPTPSEADVVTFTDYRDLVGDLSTSADAAPLAALFIDYGHQSSHFGDTLQAVREHQAEHPLTSPGEADLSMSVDFAAFARAVKCVNLASDGPVPQGAFLGSLGIVERASRLMAANSTSIQEIETAVFRLMSETGMGSRFHAIGVRSTELQTLPGLTNG